MDELIWQVDPVREHNSAEITRKQFCLNSSHKHHHNFRPDQIAYKEQTLLHAIIVQLSEKSHSLTTILFFRLFLCNKCECVGAIDYSVALEIVIGKNNVN